MRGGTYRALLVAVVADRLDRAAFQRLHALINLVLRAGLFVDVGVPAVITPGEKIRSCFPAEVTIDALLIDIELSGDVIFPLVGLIGHVAVISNLAGASQGPFPQRPSQSEYLLIGSIFVSEARSIATCPRSRARNLAIPPASFNVTPGL